MSLRKKLAKWIAGEPEAPPTPKPTPVKKKLSPKEEATLKKEPYVNFASVEFDPNDSNLGSIEIDYNEYFVLDLRRKGYPGETDDDVVDMWFRQVCRNILMETYEQEVANIDQESISRYINRKDIGGGKTEVS